VRDSRLKETEGETRERERRGKWRERGTEERDIISTSISSLIVSFSFFKTSSIISHV
jgi:hypothetical protein